MIPSIENYQKQVNLRCNATRLAGTTSEAEEVFVVHSSPASYCTGKTIESLKNLFLVAIKIFHRTKCLADQVVSDKTKFLNFQPDKCPMSGAISRLALKIWSNSWKQKITDNNFNFATIIGGNFLCW